jgi:hypothetical protein
MCATISCSSKTPWTYPKRSSACDVYTTLPPSSESWTTCRYEDCIPRSSYKCTTHCSARRQLQALSFGFTVSGSLLYSLFSKRFAFDSLMVLKTVLHLTWYFLSKSLKKESLQEIAILQCHTDCCGTELYLPISHTSHLKGNHELRKKFVVKKLQMKKFCIFKVKVNESLQDLEGIFK